MLDKIFKNNTIMGIVALLTLVAVGYMSYNLYQSKKAAVEVAE